MGIDNPSYTEGKAERNSDITIFWRNGKLIGQCLTGKESQWLQTNRGEEDSLQPDRQTRSTEANWQAYVRARAKRNNGGSEMSEAEAQRYL